MKWKQLFKPHILERGMEYYYAGCVEALEADDEQITAVVEGTEDYDVLIHLDRGQVLDMTCTCPYAEGGENCVIEPPLRANWGGRHLHLGSGVYANFNLTLVDDADIYVGDRVMFGPNVTIATANHPIDPELRGRGLQYNREVRIGENAWIGAGAVIVPGVTIGKNAVIGAGSVVTRDIPENTVAVGNPCRVLREISPRDREFYYRQERVDWENL